MGKKILTRFTGTLARCLLAVPLLAASFGVVALPTKAEAVSCHVFSSSQAGATDYYFYTPTYTVPSSSGCVDINIGAIGTSNHCARGSNHGPERDAGSTADRRSHVGACAARGSRAEHLAGSARDAATRLDFAEERASAHRASARAGAYHAIGCAAAGEWQGECHATTATR